MNSDNKLDQSLSPWVNAVKTQAPTESQENDMQSRLMTRLNQQADSLAQSSNSKTTGRHGAFSLLLDWLKESSSGMKLGLAASVAFAAVISINILSTRSVIAPAFADVRQVLVDMTSMKYRGEMFSQGNIMMTLDVYYQAPNLVRVETTPAASKASSQSVINILDTKQGKGLTLISAANMAMPLSFEAGNVDDVSDQNPLAWVDEIISYQGEVDILPAKWIGDQFASGYAITSGGMEITLWVNTETELPIELRVEMPNESGASPFLLEAELTFNELLAPELFSLTPPSGYNIVASD